MYLLTCWLRFCICHPDSLSKNILLQRLAILAASLLTDPALLPLLLLWIRNWNGGCCVFCTFKWICSILRPLTSLSPTPAHLDRSLTGVPSSSVMLWGSSHSPLGAVCWQTEGEQFNGLNGLTSVRRESELVTNSRQTTTSQPQPEALTLNPCLLIYWDMHNSEFYRGKHFYNISHHKGAFHSDFLPNPFLGTRK